MFILYSLWAKKTTTEKLEKIYSRRYVRYVDVQRNRVKSKYLFIYPLYTESKSKYYKNVQMQYLNEILS